MFNDRSNTAEYNDNRVNHPTSSIVGGDQINVTDPNFAAMFALPPDFNTLLKIALIVIIASVIVSSIIAMVDAYK